jgi:hypothetical protein
MSKILVNENTKLSQIGHWDNPTFEGYFGKNEQKQAIRMLYGCQQQ